LLNLIYKTALFSIYVELQIIIDIPSSCHVQMLGSEYLGEPVEMQGIKGKQ